MTENNKAMTAPPAKVEERAVEFIPFGASDLVRLTVAMAATTAGRSFFDLLQSWWHDLVFWVTG